MIAESQGELRLWPLVLACLVSAACHWGAMYGLSDVRVLPTPSVPRTAPRWRTNSQVQVSARTLADPLAPADDAWGTPAPAPVVEDESARMERLADRPETTMPVGTPELAARESSEAADDALRPEAARVPRADLAPADRLPAPEFAESAPIAVRPADLGLRVGGGGSVMERLNDRPAAVEVPRELPSLSRVEGRGGRGLGRQGGSDGGEAERADGLPPPVPDLRFRSVPGMETGSGAGSFGLGAKAVAAAEAERRAARAEEKKGEAEDIPKSVMPKVDERVVELEKEAVRELREAKAGIPFDRRVTPTLESWIDPLDPGCRYFRVRIDARPADAAVEPLPVVAKDLVFLIDASGSIGDERLRACAKKVEEAFGTLNSNDRFNLVAFRNDFTCAFPAWVEAGDASFERASAWLKNLRAHGNTDVFRTIRSVLTMPRTPSRPLVACVITDGEATSGMRRSAEIVSAFNALNGGLVSMYMYGVKPDANDYLMEMIARGSRGGWSKMTGFRKFRGRAANQLPELVTRFSRPVLSDVEVVFSAASRADVYPRLVANLALDEPIELWGACPADKREIVFAMRGLNGSDVFESVFRLAFDSARPAGRELKKEWAGQRLFALVADYSARPSPELMAEIRRVAGQNELPIPYERQLGK